MTVGSISHLVTYNVVGRGAFPIPRIFFAPDANLLYPLRAGPAVLVFRLGQPTLLARGLTDLLAGRG